MYCPRCAKEFESGTSYCRTCGLSLDGVATIVKGEAETEPEFKTGPNRDLMRIGFGCFIFGIVIALGNALVRDLGLWPYDFGKYVFLILVMVGMLLLGVGIVFPKKRYVKRKRSTLPERDEEKQLRTNRLDQLPHAKRSVDDLVSQVRSREPGSVTEPTTRQLR
jgi:hypothetical protein